MVSMAARGLPQTGSAMLRHDDREGIVGPGGWASTAGRAGHNQRAHDAMFCEESSRGTVECERERVGIDRRYAHQRVGEHDTGLCHRLDRDLN
jgi:hypothetical protein